MQSVQSLYNISQQDLAAWGVDDVAYVKSVQQDGKIVYAIHAADGTQMALVRDRDIAWAAIRQHDLEPVSVH